MSELVRLNIGCGPIRRDGEIGVDREPTSARDVVGDLLGGLPFEDGAAEFVRLDHVLEHLPYRSAVRALREAMRVLAPRGAIRVGVPDLQATCRAYADAPALATRAFLLRSLYGSQAHAGEFHQSGWDPETLEDLLEAVGFTEVIVQPDPDRDEGICIVATAVRP